jgi:TonB family protein
VRLPAIFSRRATAGSPPPAPAGVYVASSEDYGQGLRVSVMVHAGFAAAVILRFLVFPTKPAVFVPTLRVDIVGLPDILKKDLSKVPRAPSLDEIAQALKHADEQLKKNPPPKPLPNLPKPEPEPDRMVLHPKRAAPEVSEATREKRLHTALARVKALERIEQKESSPVVKGNKVSKGTSLSGDAKEAAQASYYDTLRERLQENWALPVWIARQELSAQVRIFIDARGRLHNYAFMKPSGNAQFDDAVKKAIADSSPFPAPPAELGSGLLADGILVGFPL